MLSLQKTELNCVMYTPPCLFTHKTGAPRARVNTELNKTVPFKYVEFNPLSDSSFQNSERLASGVGLDSEFEIFLSILTLCVIYDMKTEI
jgi:hypothetical protein